MAVIASNNVKGGVGKTTPAANLAWRVQRAGARAATFVIVPVPPSPLSLRAFHEVARQVGALGDKRPPLLPVFSMVDRRRTLNSRAVGDHPDWPVVSMASAVEQGSVRRQPVAAFAPSAPASQEIGRLWAAIEQRVLGG